MTAYIEKWNVDIGDKVQKGDVLADLFVPELREHWGTKKATVAVRRGAGRAGPEGVEVAAAEVKAAEARLEEAKAILGKYEAEVERWDVQVKRLAARGRAGGGRPPDPAGVAEPVEGDIAARDAAKATIAKAEAELLADEATLAKAEVNVAVARADLAVAESEAKRLEAWVGYLKLLAPFDGIVVARNANTWDFVLPTTGDPTADAALPTSRPAAGRADLRGRSHRHRPDLRRHPRAGCQLRPHRDRRRRV